METAGNSNAPERPVIARTLRVLEDAPGSDGQVVPEATPARPETTTPVTSTVGLLTFLAVAYTLHFAADLLIPIMLAVFLHLLLSPLVRGLSRRGVPASVGAALVVAGLVAIAGAGVTFLAEPAEQWLEEAPRSVRGLRAELGSVRGPLEGIQELSDEVGELAKVDGAARVQAVQVREPGVLENVIVGLPAVVASISIVVFLTYFLLASNDRLLRRITQLGRSWSTRRRIVAVSRRVQSEVSRYLVTVTAINLALGCMVTLTMYLLEVPNPILWGTIAGILNFAPYVGAAVAAVILALVGIASFDTLGEALLVPAAYLSITTLEGYLITPTIVGRRLSLSPSIVFLSVVVWGWLWGIVGALIAVPMVATLKIILENLPRTRPFAKLLGD